MLRQALTTLASCCFTCPYPAPPSLSPSSEINILLVAICFRSQKPQIRRFPTHPQLQLSSQSQLAHNNNRDRSIRISEILQTKDGAGMAWRHGTSCSLVLSLLFFSLSDLNTFSRAASPFSRIAFHSKGDICRLSDFFVDC